MGELDVAAYLARLGTDHPGPPSVTGLFALHRAHVERVPYENLEIQLGRGVYCYHLNGALSALLRALGYRVRWHVGGVQARSVTTPPGANANHLALTVHGLATSDCPHGVWLVDAGLGDGPHEPLPLRTGCYRQGPFTYQLSPSEVVPEGWRFTHDPAGSFTGMDFAWPTAGPAAFAEQHNHLSTSPESGFVRTLVVKRRHATGVDMLRGLLLTRLNAGEERQEQIDASPDLFGTLADVFGLTLDDVHAAERARLWQRVRAAHEAWLVERAAS
jgi:N-hydroxyarylamine O-acetyltransferase